MPDEYEPVYEPEEEVEAEPEAEDPLEALGLDDEQRAAVQAHIDQAAQVKIDEAKGRIGRRWDLARTKARERGLDITADDDPEIVVADMGKAREFGASLLGRERAPEPAAAAANPAAPAAPEEIDFLAEPGEATRRVRALIEDGIKQGLAPVQAENQALRLAMAGGTADRAIDLAKPRLTAMGLDHLADNADFKRLFGGAIRQLPDPSSWTDPAVASQVAMFAIGQLPEAALAKPKPDDRREVTEAMRRSQGQAGGARNAGGVASSGDTDRADADFLSNLAGRRLSAKELQLLNDGKMDPRTFHRELKPPAAAGRGTR